MNEVPRQDLRIPVRAIGADSPDERPEDATALCLSGGGYRAMLFHLGALIRLNELGYLPRLDRISSVSGGSITAAVLGRSWADLDFDTRGVARRFDELVVGKLRRLAGHTLDWKAVLSGLLLPGSTVNARLASAYRRHLFHSATLESLPKRPFFVINATNLQSGALWRFTSEYIRDWRVGKIEDLSYPLADAVAASSAFPPVLSPARPRFSDTDYAAGSGEGWQMAPFTTRPVLADGGVYDNLGLETAWKRCRTVLVSDGGGRFTPRGERWANWGAQGLRVFSVVDSQVRALRKHQVIASFEAEPIDIEHFRAGAYWGIRSHVADYELPSSLDCPLAATERLAKTPTRLARLDPTLQERLINWGYAICDTAMRRWVVTKAPPPAGFPYHDVGLGSA